MMHERSRRLNKMICLIGLTLAFAGGSSGCSRDPYSVARVTGTVLCNGKPATGGTVILRPLDAPEKTGRPKSRPGQIATGEVGPDGKFSLMLDAVGQDRKRTGALTGPSEVIFKMPRTEPAQIEPADERLPELELKKLKEEFARIPVYPALECGRAIWPDNVDVKQGGNVFNFILLPKSFEPPEKKRKRQGSSVQDHIKVDPSKLDPALTQHANK